ncbi:MAG: hypothetical protein EXS47_02560 [Candidatus Zambryskibacteria bacterium]|nr:hypothetical protein [Candidatus Zambryskibacteria bacterium]
MNRFEQGSRSSENRLSRLSDEEQVRAVEKGIKPIATSTTLIKTDLPYLKMELPVVTLEIRNGHRVVVEKRIQADYIYYQPDQEFNAHRMKRMMENYITEESKAKIGDEVSAPPTGPEDEKYHREIGKLLGYTDEEVDDFLKRIYR